MTSYSRFLCAALFPRFEKKLHPDQVRSLLESVQRSDGPTCGLNGGMPYWPDGRMARLVLDKEHRGTSKKFCAFLEVHLCFVLMCPQDRRTSKKSSVACPLRSLTMTALIGGLQAALCVSRIGQVPLRITIPFLFGLAGLVACLERWSWPRRIVVIHHKE